jgi:hypothetical protein
LIRRHPSFSLIISYTFRHSWDFIKELPVIEKEVFKKVKGVTGGVFTQVVYIAPFPVCVIS